MLRQYSNSYRVIAILLLSVNSLLSSAAQPANEITESGRLGLGFIYEVGCSSVTFGRYTSSHSW